MSGRHKPLMHVIFLFSPAISPAFPHRSLLFPTTSSTGYISVSNPVHYLSWSRESDFTEIQNMLPPWTNWTFLFPLQGAVCSQTRCDLEWAPQGFLQGGLEGLEEKFLSDYSQEQIPGCTCSAQHWITYPISLDPILGWGVPMQSWLCLFPQLSAQHWRFSPAEDTWLSHNKPV